jgi:hypothetical protein
MGKGRSDSERLLMEWRQMRRKENKDKGDSVTRILRERQEQISDKSRTKTKPRRVYETWAVRWEIIASASAKIELVMVDGGSI